jgi:hypothetical protein
MDFREIWWGYGLHSCGLDREQRVALVDIANKFPLSINAWSFLIGSAIIVFSRRVRLRGVVSLFVTFNKYFVCK